MRRSSLALAAVVVSGIVVASHAAAALQQTPKHGGTLVFRLPAPDPACLNVLADSCISGALSWIDEVLQKPYESVPTSRTRQASSRRSTHEEFHVHADLPHPPRSALERRSSGTAQDFIFTLQAIRRHGSRDVRELHAPIRSWRAVDPKTLRVVLRRKSASWTASSGTPPGARAPWFGPHAGLERPDRDPRTGRPSEVARSSSSGSSAAAARSPAQPPLLGTASGLRRSARLRFSSRLPMPSMGCRAVSSTSPWAFHQRSSRLFVSWRRSARRACRVQLRAARHPARTERQPALRNSSFVARSRTGSTAPRSSGRYGRDRSFCSRPTVRCTRPKAATTSRTGARTAIHRRRPAACSSKRAAAEERTESSPVAESGSRCAS